MTRPLKPLLAVSALLLAVAGWLAWSRSDEARRWESLRPAVPASAGESAPGLDARLASAAAKFATWPPDRVALAEFAQLCHVNGRLDEAMRAYEALMLVEPAEARWPHHLAHLLAGYGRMVEALPLLEKATVLAPDEPIVWQRLGEVRLKNN